MCSALGGGRGRARLLAEDHKDVEDVAKQMVERFHPDDRIMAWFDFFNHDSDRVCRNMTAYMERVVPLVESMLEAKR